MKVEDFGALTKAEKGLIAHLRAGKSSYFSASDKMPSETTPTGQHIRSTLVCALALQQVKNCPTPEHGVKIANSFIRGNLHYGIETKGIDLEGATLNSSLALLFCYIPDPIILRNASIKKLNLYGSLLLKGIRADSLEVKHDLLLRHIEAKGEIRLLGAKIGGDLSCTGARLNAPDKSLSADGIKIGGQVSLRDVIATGEVRLRSATIGGDVSCSNTRLTNSAYTLICGDARIAGTWFWRNDSFSLGKIDLTGARIDMIGDDPACWPDEILLNRCQYGGFIGQGVTGAARVNWLSRMKPQEYGDDFWPQPYEECARALREAGHGADAREVLIKKEELQRQARHDRLGREYDAAKGKYLRLDIFLQRWLLRFWDWVIWWTVAYGRRPLQAFVPLLFLLLFGALIFGAAAWSDQIKPNLPQTQRADEWVACADRPESRIDCFLAQAKGASYPRFNAFVYSADTLLPVVALEMQSYWIPDDRKPFGRFARIYLWIHIAMGWGLTLLAVAGFSGLIKTDNTK